MSLSGEVKELDLSHCLVPLLEAMGWKGDHLHLIEAMPYPSEQMDFTDILNSMANLNFESEVNHIRMDRLDQHSLPCFFLSDDDRAFVLLRKSDNALLAYVEDSREYLEIEPEAIWGRSAEFKPMVEGVVSLMDSQNNWFYKVLARFKKIIYVGFSMSILLSLLAIASPVLIMFLYSQIQVHSPVFQMGMIALGVGIYLSAELILKLMRAQLFNFVGSRLSSLVGNQVIRRVLYLAPGYTESPTVSSQISRIKEFETIHDFFSGTALTTIFDTFLIILLIVALTIIGGELVYIPIAAIVIFFIFGFITKSVIKRISAESSKSMASKQEMLMEMMFQMRAFRTGGFSDYWFERFKQGNAEAALHSFQSVKVNALISNFSHFLINTAGILTVSFGVLKVLNSTLSMSALMGVMLITFRILTPLKSFFSTVGQFERAMRSVKQIDRFMGMDLECQGYGEISTVTKLKGNISMNNVSLRYSTDHHPALLNVSMNFKNGSTVVICGPGGSGRSSVLRAMMRLAEPQTGQVFIDGINVRQLDPLNLRYSFSYIPSETQLFAGTLRENIMFSDPAADDEAMQRALDLSDLQSDIGALPEGLDTFIDPLNSAFTDEFHKKIGLARGFLRETNIVLFDKPEAGLSPHALEFFVEKMREISGVATMIFVSNNRKFFEIADQAVLMKAGRVKMIDSPKTVLEEFYSGND